MSYTPHTWVDGETIDATKLNAIEQGIANAGGGKYDPYDFVIQYDNAPTGYTAVKGTFASIKAMLQGEEWVTGLYQNRYISGDWIQLANSTTIYMTYNPSQDKIYLSIYYYWNENPSVLPLVWDSTGVYYND